MSSRNDASTDSPLRDDSIAGYRILQRIGEGGMGEVYEAEQLEPVRRRVALKVIKRGIDTDSVIARFEAERQALALMDHPCIARVFHAGTTARGRPFFAMEHIAGVPITEHCDRERLDTAQRLALFVQVCDGVQHAHQRAVIHRDLKPSNVLVTLVDGQPVPKIIDFGVAKATSQPLTERTLFTELGQLVGTPEYMSPEQAEMTGHGVDTRSDVYSLGAVLYELLVGVLPFDPATLRRAGFDEIRRQIREVEPPKPSTRVGTLGADSTAMTARRRSSPQRLNSDLRGDLDWITMKALEKDRARRYGSPAEFAADLQRHLRHEPVLAGPPSALYRLRKFVRRHRLGASVTAATVVIAATFVVHTAVQNEVIAAERDRAQREAAKATAVNAFLQDMLAAAQPAHAQGRVLTVREVLDDAEAALQRDPPEPVVAASVHQTLGRTFRALGLLDPAHRHLQAAAEFHRRTDPTALEAAQALYELALVHFDQADYGRAREAAVAARDGFTARGGSDDADVLRCRHLLAQLTYNEGDYEAAITELEHVLARRRQLHGDGSNEVAVTLRSLAFVHDNAEQQQRALPLAEQALAITLRLRGELHPDVVSDLLQVADVQAGLGLFDAAERNLRAAQTKAEQLYGAEHPGVANCAWRLGVLLFRRGDVAAAAPLLESALQQRRALLRAPHKDIATAACSLAKVRVESGDLQGAAALLEEAMATRRQVFGEAHVAVAATLDDLAELQRKQARPSDAEALYRRAIAMWQRCRGADSAEEANSTQLLALVLQDQMRLDDAEVASREALRLWRRLYPNGHPRIAAAINNLGSLLFRKGEEDTAESLLGEALTLRRSLLSPRHPGLTETLSNLAVVREARGALVEAEPLLREVLANYEGTLPAGHRNALTTKRRLARNLIGQRQWAAATALLLDVREAETAANSPPAARRSTVDALIQASEGAGDTAQAARWQQVRSELGEDK